MKAIRGEKLRPFLILNDLVQSQSAKTERIGWYCATCYSEMTEKTIHIRTYTSSPVSKRKSSDSTVESDIADDSDSRWGSDSGGNYSSGSDFGGGMSDGGGGGGSW
jgi:uncharacterized protein